MAQVRNASGLSAAALGASNPASGPDATASAHPLPAAAPHAQLLLAQAQPTPRPTPRRTTPPPARPLTHTLRQWNPEVQPAVPFEQMNPQQRWEHAIRVAARDVPELVGAKLWTYFTQNTGTMIFLSMVLHMLGRGWFAAGVAGGLSLFEVLRLWRQLQPVIAEVNQARHLMQLETAGRKIAKLVSPVIADVGASAAIVSAGKGFFKLLYWANDRPIPLPPRPPAQPVIDAAARSEVAKYLTDPRLQAEAAKFVGQAMYIIPSLMSTQPKDTARLASLVRSLSGHQAVLAIVDDAFGTLLKSTTDRRSLAKLKKQQALFVKLIYDWAAARAKSNKGAGPNYMPQQMEALYLQRNSHPYYQQVYSSLLNQALGRSAPRHLPRLTLPGAAKRGAGGRGAVAPLSADGLLKTIGSLLGENVRNPRRALIKLPTNSGIPRTPADALAVQIQRLAAERGIRVSIEHQRGVPPTLTVDRSTWSDGARTREEAERGMARLFTRITELATQAGYRLNWRAIGGLRDNDAAAAGPR